MNALNLGSGGMVIPGYINTDVDDLPGVDLVLDASKIPYPFEDESLDEIINSHMIEHLQEDKILPMLKEWYRILKPTGKAVVDVPDLEKAIEMYSQNKYSWIKLLELIYGLQDERDHQRHQWGYSPKTLREYCLKAGFTDVKQVETDDYHLKHLGIPTFRLEARK